MKILKKIIELTFQLRQVFVVYIFDSNIAAPQNHELSRDFRKPRCEASNSDSEIYYK